MATITDPDHGSNKPLLLDAERLFLRVLLASPDGTGTLTEATPPGYMTKPYPRGGKWRGVIPRRLAGRGIIAPVLTPEGRLSSHRSHRKARNGGIARVWRLVDPSAGRRRLQELDTYFARNPSGLHLVRNLFDLLGEDPFLC
ncbi:MAG: hypothetical protein JWO38_1106 [Gemmataceae bacterium]|nr:hypothetical protein [Gemmataceae bacterium]